MLLSLRGSKELWKRRKKLCCLRRMLLRKSVDKKKMKTRKPWIVCRGMFLSLRGSKELWKQRKKLMESEKDALKEEYRQKENENKKALESASALFVEQKRLMKKKMKEKMNKEMDGGWNCLRDTLATITEMTKAHAARPRTAPAPLLLDCLR
ncbi:OLC1v1037957C1 [Oldenlandia corymbosa var. corymbosa]|uniref:OLC1v1037957C1 n=1 Tax=Oldenlandia corymbosa var. corymbosa TaxID=529605 RepID=A0AAV1CYT2_OLDCO|nr:OLC1v1037957C1 [Oldenlandia corymbosa var. corymbosa]